MRYNQSDSSAHLPSESKGLGPHPFGATEAKRTQICLAPGPYNSRSRRYSVQTVKSSTPGGSPIKRSWAAKRGLVKPFYNEYPRAYDGSFFRSYGAQRGCA